MYCKNCGREMNDLQDVCLNCGVKKGNGTSYCQNCGSNMTTDARFCAECGAPVKVSMFTQRSVNNANPDYLNGNDKVTMALICFFLGFIGIHNFMLGENKKGILKIILTPCFGIGYILSLIDFVKILTDKYEINKDSAV